MKYPRLEIKKFGDYMCAIIHLSKKESSLALPSRESLMVKLEQLLKDKKLNRYFVLEFLRKAFFSGMIDSVIESEEGIPLLDEVIKPFIRKMETDLTAFNPFSEKPRLRSTEFEGQKCWFFSGDNFCSDPFFNKEDGMMEISDLSSYPESNNEELQQLTDLLHQAKEIPGNMNIGGTPN